MTGCPWPFSWRPRARICSMAYLARRWKASHHHRHAARPHRRQAADLRSLISLVQIHALPGWMAVLIIGREFAVSRIAQHRRRRRLHHQGQRSGQDQNVLPGGGHLGDAAQRSPPGAAARRHGVDVGRGFFSHLVSAVSYFAKFWHKVDESVKNRRPPRAAHAGAQAAARHDASEDGRPEPEAPRAPWATQSGSRPK